MFCAVVPKNLLSFDVLGKRAAFCIKSVVLCGNIKLLISSLRQKESKLQKFIESKAFLCIFGVKMF